MQVITLFACFKRIARRRFACDNHSESLGITLDGSESLGIIRSRLESLSEFRLEIRRFASKLLAVTLVFGSRIEVADELALFQRMNCKLNDSTDSV